MIPRGSVGPKRGRIISPNFPKPYDEELTCEVTLSFAKRVSIQFQSFDIQSGTDGKSCNYDWLEVHDGDSSESDSSPLVAQLCGYDIPDPLNSTGFSLTLLLHSDNNLSNNTGFKIIADTGKI